MRTVTGEFTLIVKRLFGVMRAGCIDVVAHQGAVQGVAVAAVLTVVLVVTDFKRRLRLHVVDVQGRRLGGDRRQTP